MNEDLKQRFKTLKKSLIIAGNNFDLLISSKNQMIQELSEASRDTKVMIISNPEKDFNELVEDSYQNMVKAGKAIDEFENIYMKEG